MEVKLRKQNKAVLICGQVGDSEVRPLRWQGERGGAAHNGN